MDWWIGDTGASSHMCKVWKGFSNTKNINIKAEFAREDHEGKVDKRGTWTGIVQVLKKQGNITPKQTIELHDVLYVPELRTNLFSIMKEIKTSGAKISNDDDILILKYPDGTSIYFDHILSTAKGFIPSARIKALDMQPLNMIYNHFSCNMWSSI